MKFLGKIILIIFLFISSIFAGEVATITALKGNVFVLRDAKETALKLGDKVQEKDTIITKNKTKVQIIFKDETIISIGKNSNFSVNEYLFEDSQPPVAKFSMLKGAMRVITGRIGKVAPDKFSIKTKTATMGIRGTNFTLVVGEDGSYQAYCTFGAISVKVNGQEHVVQQGFMLEVGEGGKVIIKEFSAQELKAMKEKNMAKSEPKKGSASKDATASNEGQIDNTREEEGNMIIKDISDSVVDAKQSGTTDLAGLLAGYAMSDALYTGTYSLTNSGDAPGNGVAELEIDFGADTVKLTLDPGNFDHIFDQNPVLGGTSLNVEDGQGGTATGTFSGSTGNSVEGTINGSFGAGPSSGEYSVTSSQPLK